MLYDIHVHIITGGALFGLNALLSATYDFPGLMKLQIWMAFMLYMCLLEILQRKFKTCLHLRLPT